MLNVIVNFAKSLVENARDAYGVGEELRFFAYQDGSRRLAFEVVYQGELVFEVGFLLSADPRRFFKMTKRQAEETFRAFFQAKGGRAA